MKESTYKAIQTQEELIHALAELERIFYEESGSSDAKEREAIALAIEAFERKNF